MKCNSFTFIFQMTKSGASQELSCLLAGNLTISQILCSICGTATPPNNVNMCPNCLCLKIPITSDLPSRVSIVHCPDCVTYLQPPSTWLRAERDSKELLSFCLKTLKKLAEFRLIDAKFLLTEPRSRRRMIKLRVKVQREVLDRVYVEKSHDIEYVVVHQRCPSCCMALPLPANPDHWEAVVQARQYVPHMRTFLYLEDLIKKHSAANSAVRLKRVNQGLDFFFAKKRDAVKFFEFMCSVVPVKSQTFHKTAFTRFSMAAVISPICHDDLIYISPKLLSSKLGQIGPLVICTKVKNTITLLNPFTLVDCVIDGDQYWRAPFEPILSSKQLIEYIVLDVVMIVSAEVDNNSKRNTLADVEIARVSDFGKNDRIISVRTHLGHLLKTGDHALGYDLDGANFNNAEAEENRGLFPSAVLIKKKFSDDDNWQEKKTLKKACSKKKTNNNNDSEYEQFLRDLEDDPGKRFNISLDTSVEDECSHKVESTATGADAVPFSQLEDVFADLDLSDGCITDAE